MDGNLNGHLDGDVLDHWDLHRDGLRYKRRGRIPYRRIRLWYGHRCGNWEWDTV